MFMVLMVSCVLVILCVSIHLLALQGLFAWLVRVKSLTRLRLGGLILGAIVAHLIEIYVFGVGTFLLGLAGDHGKIEGATLEGQLDYFYYSATTFTSLGFGDMVPVGLLRLLAAVEALSGLVLIAWTASFLFVMMERCWLADARWREIVPEMPNRSKSE